MDNGKNIRTKTDVVIFIAMGVIAMNLVISNIGLYGGRTSPPLLVGAFVMMLLSIWLIRERRCISKIRIIKLMPLIIMGVIFFVYGLIFRVPSYILYAFVFVFQLPLFCLSTEHVILNKILYAFTVSSVFIYGAAQAGAFLFSPLSDVQYYGIMGNPNLWGEYLTFALVSILYLYEKVRKKASKVFLLILFGISLAELFFSRSRTSMLAGIVVIVVYLIYACLSRKDLKKKVASLIIAAVICFPATYAVLSFVTPYIAESVGIEIEFKAESLTEQFAATSDRYLKGIATEGSISSGRVEIWRTYFSNLSMKGHDPEPLEVRRYSDVFVKMDAHNTFLQVAYQGGYPALLFFVVSIGMCAFDYLKKLFRKNIGLYECYALATLCSAVVYMLLSSSFSPYTVFAMFGYWIFVIPGYVTDGSEELKRAGIRREK